MNLMLINVSTRKFRRAVRLPEGDLLATVGDGTSKSAASRRFVALSAGRLAEWMASDLSQLDLLVIQIDGLHIGDDLLGTISADDLIDPGTNFSTWHCYGRRGRPKIRPAMAIFSLEHSSTLRGVSGSAGRVTIRVAGRIPHTRRH